jgi:hypothetical protein
MKKTPIKAGKLLRDEVNRFHTLAWFNSVSHDLKETSPLRLEKELQPWKVKRNADGKLIGSRAWDRYKVGERLPQDGYGKDGNPLAVMAAATRSPKSALLYRHPLWEAMKSPFMSLDRATELISKFSPDVAGYYGDLAKVTPINRAEILSENISLDIWIDWNDRYAAMDHLAASLMFLKIDGLRHLEDRREKCAENIVKSLGPLASSHWIGPFHEEMFDWFEKNVWSDLFDKHYPKGNKQANGWRKTKPKWLTTMESEMLENVDFESLDEDLRNRR